MKNLLKRLWKEEEGQDMVEYGLLLVLIATVAVASMQTIGKVISNVFASASTNLTTAS
jgi:pilus assembly protein Flp/PilA